MHLQLLKVNGEGMQYPREIKNQGVIYKLGQGAKIFKRALACENVLKI